MNNGVVIFDRKLLKFPLQADYRSPSIVFWYVIIAVYFFFYVVIHVYLFDLLSIKHNVMNHILEMIFCVPRVMDFIITIIPCFYLSHLGCRFGILNAIWRGLLADSEDKPAKKTNTETAILVESLRLLHAELSDLLRTFNTSHGPIILISFLFFVMDLLGDLYYIMFFQEYVIGITSFLQFMQHLIFITCTLRTATWTNEKVIKK